MKTKQLFWGFFFLTLGIMFLIVQLYSLEIAESFLWDSWPVLLILLGILVMIRGHVIKTIIAVVIAVLFAAFTFGVLQNIFDIGEVNDWQSYEEVSPTTDYYEYSPTYEYADLNSTAGWGKIKLDSSTDYLWQINSSGGVPEVSSNTDVNGNKVRSDITFQKENWHFWHKRNNRFEIKLNENPVWSLNFELGAASSTLHLEKFKVKKVSMKTGASEVKIYFGSKYPVTNLEISSGASDVTVYVPKGTGCKVSGNSLLVQKTLPDFHKDAENNYVSPNFNDSQNKLFIKLNSAAMTFEIKYL